jgi:glyoxylase-like metal-dependent hydrolase (beta-lactamase superfamily II)
LTLAVSAWERFEASLWSTTSLLVLGDGESLVVDPAISTDEVAGIEQRALELGAPIRHVLITHGDWPAWLGDRARPFSRRDVPAHGSHC